MDVSNKTDSPLYRGENGGDDITCNTRNTNSLPVVNHVVSEQNLIDLSTPQDISSKSVVPPGAVGKEQHVNSDGLVSARLSAEVKGDVADIVGVCDKLDNCSNDISANGGDGITPLYVSNTESGYLTDSVTSCQSHDRHPSFGSSDADKTPCRETQPSSSSENDITPCTENLLRFFDSGGVINGKKQFTSLMDSDSSMETKVQSGTNSRGDLINFDQTEPDRVTQMEALAKLDINCDRTKSIDIDEIYTTNCFLPRPDSLLLAQRQHVDDQQRERSTSDLRNDCTANTEKNDSRKRSRSSGFPIPRVKEGVNIFDEGMSKSLPHGQIVRRDTGLIEFIADDLQEKIRRSSPLSKTASDVSSRRSSLMSLTSIDSSASSTFATSMTSGMSMSYPQSPDCIPPIDPMAIHEIEIQARLVADSLDHMMGNLRNNLHKMSAISVGCEEAYKTSVDVTCDSVDSSIKSMYALMAKCEELSVTMEPVYKLADQIKEIKRLLDRFESQLVDKP